MTHRHNTLHRAQRTGGPCVLTPACLCLLACGAAPRLTERAREMSARMQHHHLLKAHPPLGQLVSARYLPVD